MKRRHEDDIVRMPDRLQDEHPSGEDDLLDRDYEYDHDPDRDVVLTPSTDATPRDDTSRPTTTEDRWDDARYVEDGTPTRRTRLDDESEQRLTPLFRDTQADALRSRWQEVQISFVDEPRDAVKQADALVSQAIDHLADLFRKQRDELEQQWARGEDVSTEDLRLTLQRYRSFFDRLLAI